MLPTVIALAAAVVVAATSSTVTNDELRKFAYGANYPIACGEAQLAANGLRVHRNPSPATLRSAAKSFRDCAASPTAKLNLSLANTANFSAAAALLLAARKESPPQSTTDAADAKQLADAVINYRKPYNAGGGPQFNQGTLSPLVTDAGRISRGAAALMASASTSPAGLPSSTPSTPAVDRAHS